MVIPARPRVDDSSEPEDSLVSDGTAERIGAVPRRPLVSCVPATPVQEAARLMAEHDSDFVVVLGSCGKPEGIVTDSDLRRRVVAPSLPGSTAVERVMSTPLVSVDQDAFLFEAIQLMLRHRLHHLLVLEQGQPRGVIGDADLVAARAQGPLLIRRQLDQATSIDELVGLKAAREQVINVLVRSGIGSYDLARITAETNDHLTRRILALVERELGPAPLPYCWLGLGSVGRREQTLKTDQDNALVFQDPPTGLGETARHYFTQLAERTVGALELCGFPRCHGEVMATNPRWCQPLTVWQAYFASWVRRPEVESLYNAAIFFDLRAVAGDSSFVDTLWTDLIKWIPDSHRFTQLLLREALNHRPPLGLFSELILERSGPRRGSFHVKARGLMPVVEAARVFALARGIRRTNTVERLLALRDLRAMNDRDAEDLIIAYQFIMMLRIRHQLQQIAAGEPLDDFVRPDRLPRVDRKTLKEHFKVIAGLQSFIRSELQVGLV